MPELNDGKTESEANGQPEERQEMRKASEMALKEAVMKVVKAGPKYVDQAIEATESRKEGKVLG
ncbi:MAG: hypothetical protein P4M11_10350 [Candidatus Pacebacteria bacterium]|nr:hypothetical protein [Candidatus Paceibacterota bacterium]